MGGGRAEALPLSASHVWDIVSLKVSLIKRLCSVDGLNTNDVVLLAVFVFEAFRTYFGILQEVKFKKLACIQQVAIFFNDVIHLSSPFGWAVARC
jgi:hypothetical protein